jgi:predicted RNA-binding protein YlqC (UPF0109 family)
LDQIYSQQGQVVEALVKFLFEKTGHKVAEGALSGAQADDGHRMMLNLSHADIDKFAGTEARLLRATRALLSAAATAQNTRVNLEINEA